MFISVARKTNKSFSKIFAMSLVLIVLILQFFYIAGCTAMEFRKKLSPDEQEKKFMNVWQDLTSGKKSELSILEKELIEEVSANALYENLNILIIYLSKVIKF
ncbi:MAG: hypothetical protein LBJ32_03735 [Oscillospiraceae bacterium]|jgi:hypothetical protein|nr:hypothetical protein [Oscillospiraceae bacterium]